MTGQRGFALIMTLWALVLLTVAALSLSLTSRTNSASTRNFKEDTLAYYLAVSGVEEALAYLMTDRDAAVDFIDAGGNFRTDSERPTVSGVRDVEGFRVEIRVSDEESKINLNNPNTDSLRNLLVQAGVPGDEIDGMMDSLLDWIDPDDLYRLSGAEDRYYESSGYRPKNGPLDVPEETLLIKGFKPDYLYGNEDVHALYPFITAKGEGININTASEEVLRAVGFSDPEIKAVVEQRSRGGLTAASPRLGGMGLTASRNFRVEVTARLIGSSQAVKITSILRRTADPEGPEIKTVFWKEGIESGGS